MTTPRKRITRYYHHCTECGKLICRKGGMCYDCRLAKRREGKIIKPSTPRYHKKLFPCKNNCGEMVKRNDGLCKVCIDKMRLEAGEKRQAANDKRLKDWLAKHESVWKVKNVEICPNSPEHKGHWEIIDNSTNTGKCKYCGREKDYNKIQEKEELSKILENTRD